MEGSYLKQKQTGFIVVAISFLLVLLFFAVINVGLMKPAFSNLEKQINTENLGRIQAGIEKEVEKIRQINQDWSNWDDMSAFAKGDNPDFYRENLADFGFQEENIGINLCFIFDSVQQCKYSQLWKKELGGELPLNDALKTFSYWKELLGDSWKEDTVISGIVVIDAKPLLISLGPIHSSSGSGPSNGWLIFGSFLDEEKVKDLVQTTQLSFSLHLLDEKQPDFKLSTVNKLVYSQLKDLKGQPILEVRMQVSTTIPNFQRNLMVYLLFAFAFILLFFVFIYAYFTRKNEEESQKKIDTNNKANYIVLLVILAGLLFSVSIFWFLQKQHKDTLNHTFSLDCLERKEVIHQAEDTIVSDLQWLRRVLNFHPTVTRQDFSQLCKPILQTKPFCSINWVERKNDTSYEITLQEIMNESTEPIGTNLYENPIFREAMDKSRDNGLIACTKPIKANHDGEKEDSYESSILVPVFWGGAPQTIQTRRNQLKGFIIGTFHYDAYFLEAIHQTSAKGLPTKIFDLGTAQSKELVYSHIPRFGGIAMDPSTKLHFVSTIQIANREFLLEISPNRDYLDKQSSSLHWIFLLFGIIGTMLFAIYLRKTLTLKDQAEYLATIRTKELNESREKYRSTLQSIGDGVIAVDSEGHITGLNPVAENLTGWTEKEAQGIPFQSIFNIISASTGKPVENPLTESLLTRKVVYLSNDTTLINRHGERLQIADSAAPILDSFGKLIGAVMVFHDVSSEYKMKKSLRESEEQLKIQNLLLQELMGKKDELLSIAAHDIRSPLTVIKGYADLLLLYSNKTLTNDQIEMISKIQGSTKFIIQLLNDLLDFSALESGKVHLDKQTLDYGSYVKVYIMNTIIVARQKEMEIIADIQPGIPAISIDPIKTQQVLNNLTSNAIKFSNPGSTIKIVVKADERFIYTSVIDQGPGIPENEQSNLFKPFQKTSVKSTGGEKSTGLGLVIARNIIRAHGGELSVQSKVGEGSVFTFSFPISFSNS